MALSFFFLQETCLNGGLTNIYFISIPEDNKDMNSKIRLWNSLKCFYNPLGRKENCLRGMLSV